MSNWNDLKLFNRKELLEMVPEGFKFKTKPWTHQIAAFLACISNQGLLCALDLGTGKSKVAIDTCRYLDFMGGSKNNMKVLYCCLNSAVEKMKDEVLMHSNFSAVCIKGSRKEKQKIFSEKYNFYIINYEGLRSLMTKRVLKSEMDVMDEETGLITRKKKYMDRLDTKAINQLIKQNFDVLIIDESHVIKSQGSLIFKIIKKISLKTKNRILLTGTPFGNTLLDVWAQYFVVDFGGTYSPSFSSFKKAYFENVGYWGPLWVPTKNGERFITEKLYTKAIRYKEDEVDDLPPKVFRVLNYKLGKEQRKAYNNLLEDEYNELTTNIATKAIGFRTISSGFIKSSNHIFKKNPKLELLWDIIENVYEGHKIVVFVEYTLSRKIIEKLLKKKRIKFNSLSGETKDKWEEIKTFQTNSDYRVMVANIKSGGASIDLFAATYCIFFELGGSVINHKQALKRIHRGGQKHKCFFYYLLGTGTVEVSIHRDLSNGVNAFSKIVDGEKAKKYMLGEI